MNEEDAPVEVGARTGEQSPEDEIEVDLRQTPEYRRRRARGSIFMVALLFYGLLALMCIVVAVIVVILLTRT